MASSAPSATVRIGETLRGKWRLDALLGTGGMGSVYAATHRNGMRGAVKLLHGVHQASSDSRERFLREGYIANKIAHPCVARVLDDDVAEDGSPFLVMELLEGCSLAARASEHAGILPPQTVMLAADQLLDVLAVAHEAGVIHRDIKPENIFLTTEGVVKVLDFGIARLADGGPESLSLTHTGIAMGTPSFMSPEQARGRWNLVDARSDIWAVGATMFALLAGEPVHTEGTVSEIVAATFLKQARSLGEVAKDAPPSLVAVVDRALALQQGDRWPDARSMQRALREAYQEAFGMPMPELPSRASSPTGTTLAYRPPPSPLTARAPHVVRPMSAVATLPVGGDTVASLATEAPPPFRGIGARRVALIAAASLGVLGVLVVTVALVSSSNGPSRAPAASSPQNATSNVPASTALAPSGAPSDVPSPSDVASPSATPPSPSSSATSSAKIAPRAPARTPRPAATGATPSPTSIFDRRN